MDQRTDPLVELVELGKEFDDVTAVDDIDLSVRRGEFFSLLGPSGCGKTTTLRMIAGFEHPTDGRVIIDGREANELPPNERDTNLVFQNLSLFPHMTVAENIAYGPKKSGVSADERSTLVDRYLELVDLEEFADRNSRELSGGQQQRVALARALVNEPSVLLLDEPLSSLDRKLRQHMQVELRRLHENVQGSFFYVTHDQEVAMTLSDRLAVMRDGRIEQVGPPQEIYREPANKFVADFIGDTNLLEGVVTDSHDGRSTVTVEGLEGVVIETTRSTNGTATVSIRPEDIYPCSDEEDAVVSGRVLERYFQGEKTEYLVEIPTGNLPIIEMRVTGGAPFLEEGEEVRLGINDGAPVVLG